MSKKRFDPTDTAGMLDELDQSAFFRPQTTTPLNDKTRKQGDLETSKQVIKETSKRVSYPKVTYQLDPDVIDNLDDAKKTLKRKFHIKTTLVEIVEEAIRQICKDLELNQETSKLVNKFPREQVNLYLAR